MPQHTLAETIKNRARQVIQGARQGAAATQPTQSVDQKTAASPIIDSLQQFNLGSQQPGDTAEAEEQRTGRRLNRGIVDNIRARRTAGRFGRRDIF